MKEKYEFIDLGLPSGTLWAEQNEKGHFTFNGSADKWALQIETMGKMKSNRCRDCVHLAVGRSYIRNPYRTTTICLKRPKRGGVYYYCSPSGEPCEYFELNH